MLFVQLFITGCASVNEQVSNPGVPELFLDWQMYPDPRKQMVYFGEDIIFKLIPRTTSMQLSKVTLFFDDGTSIEQPLQYTQIMSGGKYECRSITVLHAYKEDNIYSPYVDYSYGTYPKNRNKKETTFIIPPRVPTDDELKEMAFQDSVRQLMAGMNEVIKGRDPAKVKFALTSFKNANFDYGKTPDDQRDIVMIKKITTMLVNNQYSVLEKNPQALIRLAHESVVKRDKTGQPSDQYQDTLEYGLRTEYDDPSHPFVYGAEIEGVKSEDKERRIAKRASGDGQYSDKTKEQSKNTDLGRSNSFQQSTTEKEAYEALIRDYLHSLYFAKFSTADYVITIDRKSGTKEDILLQKSKPIFYDVKFATEMIERTADTQYAARILERTGNIVWVRDIVGEAKDRVIPDFVKASKKKQGEGDFNLLNLFGGER